MSVPQNYTQMQNLRTLFSGPHVSCCTISSCPLFISFDIALYWARDFNRIFWGVFSLFHSLERSVTATVCLFAVSVSSFQRKSVCFHCYGREKINLIHYVPFVCVIKRKWSSSSVFLCITFHV